MDPLWVLAAFIFGAAASRIGLPPLVGYLVAGFILNGLGVKGGEMLHDQKEADGGKITHALLHADAGVKSHHPDLPGHRLEADG